MSTNEELVELVRAGHVEALGVLWDQIERLAGFYAFQYSRRLADRTDAVELQQDLLYGCGWPALCAAVETYKPEKSKFSTWFSLYFKQEVYRFLGWQNRAGGDGKPVVIKPDAMGHAARSLDAPVDEFDEDSAALMDFVPDERAQDAYEAVETDVYQAQLRAALDAALDTLDRSASDVLRQRYLEGRTLKEIADSRGVTAGAIQLKERKAILRIRQSPARRRLERFLDDETSFYSGTGRQAFERSGSSQPERLAIRRDEMRQRMIERMSVNAETY